MLRKFILVSVASLLAGCYLRVPPEAAQSKATVAAAEISTAQEAGRSKAMEMPETRNSAVPENFNSYATEDIGNDQLCIAGTLSDEDGMNQEASLYLLNKSDRDVVWGKLLERPKDIFQSRATHCAASEGFVYVLVQDDTQSQQELSQTLIRVIKLNRIDGKLMFDKALMLPVKDAYSMSAGVGETHFYLDKNQLSVRGAYVTSEDRDNPVEFTQKIDID